MWEQTGRDPRYAPTALQQQLVADGRLGRKSGHGIYAYAADGNLLTTGPDEQLLADLVGGPVTTDPVARTLAMLVNEAVDLVHRGEASSDDVDLAMRLGAGYPRGILEWGREIGFDVVEAQLRELAAAFPGAATARAPDSPPHRPTPGVGVGPATSTSLTAGTPASAHPHTEDGPRTTGTDRNAAPRAPR